MGLGLFGWSGDVNWRLFQYSTGRVIARSLKVANARTGCYNDCIAEKFDICIRNTAGETPVKLQSDWINLNTNLGASRICGTSFHWWHHNKNIRPPHYCPFVRGNHPSQRVSNAWSISMLWRHHYLWHWSSPQRVWVITEAGAVPVDDKVAGGDSCRSHSLAGAGGDAVGAREARGPNGRQQA